MPSEQPATINTPIGTVLLHAVDERLAGIEILADAAGPALAELSGPAPVEPCESPVLRQAMLEFAQYFAGRRREFDLPLDLTGRTRFARRILEVLQNVPYGTTVTYGALAERAGFPRAARAVGRAMAANPLPIVIPCHRVVATGGPLGGYSGGEGLPTKSWLLEFERSNRERP